MRALILSGLSSIGFFEVTRVLIERIGGICRVRVVPYFPANELTWYEYVADSINDEYDEVYVVGSLNYMLSNINIGILAKRFGKVVLVPDKGYTPIAYRLANVARNVGVLEITPRRLLPSSIHSRAKYVLPYLYVEKPETLKELEENVAVPEIDVEGVAGAVVKKYYSPARITLYMLMHQLVSRGSRDMVEVYTSENIDDKYLPMLPLIARQKALMERRPVVVVHSPGRGSYAYIVVSLPATRENSYGAGVTAYDVKRFTRFAKRELYMRHVKADIAGKNTIEIMARARAVERVVDMVADMINKLTRKPVTAEKSVAGAIV